MSSCKSKEATAQSHNPERKAKGILELPANWLRDKTDQPDYEETWRPPNLAAGTAGFGVKQLSKTGGVVHTEQDSIYSGKSASYSVNGKTEEVPEEIRLEYSYDAEKAGRDPWHRQYIGPGRVGSSAGDITVEEANKKLKAWGLPPLPDLPAN